MEKQNPERPVILLEDTRNKVGKHDNISAYCERHGIQIVRQCLPTGDYMLPGGHITVDTKESLQELSMNLFNRQDKARFWREIRRAKQEGLQLWIVVEDPHIRSIKEVAAWKPKYGKVTGRTLMNEIYRCHISWGVQFAIVDKRSTAKRIIEILSQEGQK